MAFKIGPKSKRIQELEAALGVDATPVKSSVNNNNVNRSPANLRPLFSQASPVSPGLVSKFVNKIDERRDQPQTAVMCWHREPRSYKVVYFQPSSSSTRSAPPPPSHTSYSEELSELSLPAPAQNKQLVFTPTQRDNSPHTPTHKAESRPFLEHSPTSRASKVPVQTPVSPPNQPPTPTHKAEAQTPVSPPNQPPTPTHKAEASTPASPPNQPPTPTYKAEVAQTPASPPNQPPTPTHKAEGAQIPFSPPNQPPTPTHKAEHDAHLPFQDNQSQKFDASARAPTSSPPSTYSSIPQPSKIALPSHEPPKRVSPVSSIEGQTPKERALAALRKTHVVNQEPSRIPSLSVNSSFGSPKPSKTPDSPTNKESKLRIPSRTSALRAAFEREAAMINEPAKPPLVTKKQPVTGGGATTTSAYEKAHAEPPKQPEIPPSGLTDITKSWVEGEGFATGWNTKPNKFVVHARDAAGQVVIGSKCVVEMKSKHTAPIQVVVRKNTDGSHLCAYLPLSEGDFTMTITLDGRILVEKQVRVRPAAERDAKEIAEAALKQAEANKRHEGEKSSNNSNDSNSNKSEGPPPSIKRVESGKSEIPPPTFKRIESGLRQPSKIQEKSAVAEKAVHEEAKREESAAEVEARKQAEAEEQARKEEERQAESVRQAQLSEERQEEARRQEAERLAEEERQAQEERERAEAEAIAKEKEAYEAAARQVAEEEERQEAEQELRLLEQEEERHLTEARLLAEQEEARLLAERAETERLLEEEFEIARREADLEEAEEARKTATRLREEAEVAQRQMELEFEEATRLAEAEELEEMRLQSELELARHREEEVEQLHAHEEDEHHQQGQSEEHELPPPLPSEEPSFIPEGNTPIKQAHHEEEAGADWVLPSPTHAKQSEERGREDSLYGLDPEEAVRQAVNRGKSRTPVKHSQVEDEGGVIAEEDSDVAKALSEATYRAQQSVIQAEIERMKAEEEGERVAKEIEEERERVHKQEAETERQRLEEEQRQAESTKKQQQLDIEANNIVNFHAPISHNQANKQVGGVAGKDELRKQVPQKRPPPPQKRPPAPPSGATQSSPKPSETKTSTVSPSFSPPSSRSSFSSSSSSSSNSNSTIMCGCGESNPLNMKFCSGCGKRLAGGVAAHTTIHSFVEAQRVAADKARHEADPGLAAREEREAREEKERVDEQERQRVLKEETDARTWEETQRALDAAEQTPPPLPPFGNESVMFHMPPTDTATDNLSSPSRLSNKGGGVVDPSKCWLDGDGAEVGWHTRSNRFMVHARDAEGKPVLDTKCVVEMKSISAHVPNISVVVHKNADGIHTCAYMPFHEGDFMLSVMVNGQTIKDTPKKVTVKRR